MSKPAAVVLVEGASDAAAIEMVAARRGRDLEAEGVAVVPMGGATNIRHFVDRFGPDGLDLRLAGLCDAGEERLFQTTLERAGFGAGLTRGGMERLGFFVCDRDLEDELIRCLGVAAVEQVVESQRDLARSASCNNSPPNADGPPRISCGASWAPGADANTSTHASSSKRSISIVFHCRWTVCSPTCDSQRLIRSAARQRHTGFVGDHDELGPVASVEFHQQTAHVGLDGCVAT